MKEKAIKMPKRTLKRFFNKTYLYNLKRREISGLNKKKIEMQKNIRKKLIKIKQKR